MRDAFGLYRGWSKTHPTKCLDYTPTTTPHCTNQHAQPLCANCHAHPTQHALVPNENEYDPHSAQQIKARALYDDSLLPPHERAARRKALADDAFRKKNYRDAYEHYAVAIDADPASATLRANRCQALLKANRLEAALDDANAAVRLSPEWAKAHYRLGCCLRRLRRPAEAHSALSRACELEPESAELRRETVAAAAAVAEAERREAALDKARKSTTRRQAYDAKTVAEHEAKLRAKQRGEIKQTTEWTDDQRRAWEAEYEASWTPPPGVQLLRHHGDVDDDGGDDDEQPALEGNAEVVAGGGGDDDDDDDACSAASSDSDLRPPEQFEVGGTTIMLPPRNYTLVDEEGRLLAKDDFEPMSFGMQQVHHDKAPEPVWVQTQTARWKQSASELTVIAYTVPAELRRAAALRVTIAPRQLHVAAAGGAGAVFLHGELEERIDPSASTWTTDGSTVVLTLTKANLMLYDGQKKGPAADTHWHRLFTSDQYVERGMVDADYSDLPMQMRREQKMADLKRKAKQATEKAENECAICGLDVRFFCKCREGDADYERPVPEGYKDPRLGFVDPVFEGIDYGKTSAAALERARPPAPRPYAGA